MTDSLADDLIEWFQYKSKKFDVFLARYPDVTEWVIAADFCFEKKKQAYVFTIIPITQTIDEVLDEIGAKMPRDLKSIREVSPEVVEYLKSEQFFHFAFVASNHRKAEGSDVKELIVKMVEYFQRSNSSPELIKSFESLGTGAEAKSFNTRLFMDMMLLCNLFCFIIFLLFRDARASSIIISPDRDKMTEWLDGLYGDIVKHMVRHTVLTRFPDAASPRVRKTAQAPGRQTKDTWFDPLVRLPDYIAGPLATMKWKGEPEENNKHSALRAAFQNNQNMLFCEIDFHGEAGPSEFSFFRFDPMIHLT